MEIVRIDPADDELFARWTRSRARAFLEHPPSPEDLAHSADWRIEYGERDRSFAAVDGDEIVATFESYDADAPVVVAPGSPGSLIAVDNISAVTVSATHRRRGLLTRWMTASLRDAKERGMPLASLIASEARIYGRYGFGPVIESVRWSVATDAAALREPTRSCGGTHAVSFVSDDEVRGFGPALYDAARMRQPGAAPRPHRTWDRILKADENDRRLRLHLAHRDADGVIDGHASLAITEEWHHRVPRSSAVIVDLTVTRADVASCLWRSCLAIDLVATVDATDRPLGDPVGELLLDRRAARQVDRSDLYWWRILDVPAALGSRWWAGPGSVTVEVTDILDLAAGRWRLDVDATGQAQVTPTATSADLTLGADSLATVLAGQGSLIQLAAAGLIDEHTSGAVATLDRLAWAPAEAYVTYTWF